MRQEARPFHSSVLSRYNSEMYLTLLYKHHIITETTASYLFEDEHGEDLDCLYRGYFALKEVNGRKMKYFIDETHYKDLPIRINSTKEIFYKEGARKKAIILSPTEITPFRINPERCFGHRAFFDELAPFEHTEPDQWTLLKIVAVMGYIGKLFLGISSHPEMGKTSIYLILDALTKKCPVFQPRSVPGVLAQITSTGNMIFDDIHAAPGDVKRIMENFSFHVAGNAPIYVNGALRSRNTKETYDVSQQSITYLYNEFTDYPNPAKSFWNRLWNNNAAMESRFLCLKLTGKLTEVFDKNFNIVTVANDNKMFFIKLAKHMLYLKELKMTNAYERRYKHTNKLNLKGRHLILYSELLWGIDIYSENQAEFDRMVKILDSSIRDYHLMLGQTLQQASPFNGVEVQPKAKAIEEFVYDEATKEVEVMELLKEKKEMDIPHKSSEYRMRCLPLRLSLLVCLYLLS